MYSNTEWITLVSTSDAADGITVEQSVTYIYGVYLDRHQGGQTLKSGITTDDNATLYIPENSKAIDAYTGLQRSYIPIQEYEALSSNENKSAYYTLNVDGDSAGACFFAFGRIPVTANNGVLDYASLRKTKKDVYRVTSFDDFSRGQILEAYIRIGGK